MDCRLFVLGREAMFGYPYAHYEWRHPFDGEMHLLRIDRGPETAFVEQLQTDGYGKRWDAMTAGFGTYEQVRMAKETGGRFFMLPGQEDKIHRVTDRKFNPETMDHYRPDLRPRAEQVAEIKGDPLKSLITKVVYDLNPFEKDRADVLTIRHWYSRNPQEMASQVRKEQSEVIPYGRYLDEAIEVMEKNIELRDNSTSFRWQANFDLILGQLYAYRCRAYEYGVSSELFLQNPTPPNPERPEYMEFRGWELRTRKELVAADKTQADADRADELLKFVTKEYAGTPWATRAAWEVKRGYGSTLVPHYFDLRRKKSDQKGLLRFSILSLLGMTALFALVVALFAMIGERAKWKEQTLTLREEVRQLREANELLDVVDPKKIYVRAMASPFPRMGQWRVHLPKGSDYRLKYDWKDLPPDRDPHHVYRPYSGMKIPPGTYTIAQTFQFTPATNNSEWHVNITVSGPGFGGRVRHGLPVDAPSWLVANEVSKD
ncbi:unnamed protein product, partial [Symbiodinium microadriaticum]